MAKLELALLVGAESKAFLNDLTKIVDRMEAFVGGKTKVKAKVKQAEVDEDGESENDEDRQDSKSTKSSRASKSIDEDDEGPTDSTLDDEESMEESEEDDTDRNGEEDEEAPVVKAKSKKAAKAPKLTSSDVSAACKALAKHIGGENGRNHVLKILKKKFNTSSITEIDEDQYADVIAAMAIPDEE